jgi:hypothetical protein
MKKHKPLSTAETLSGATSPRLKQRQAIQPRACFSGGLVGLLFQDFNVSQVDTFIEMPFSALTLFTSAIKAKPLQTLQRPDLQADRHIPSCTRARNQRVSQEISFSVED